MFREERGKNLMSKKSKNGNGTSKIATVVTLIIALVTIVFTVGLTYGSLSAKIKTVDEVATQANDRSYRNEKAIISIQRDIKYILEGVNELRRIKKFQQRNNL